MKLLCAGDSWCYGSDLGEHLETLRYSRLLGQTLGAASVVNLAKPGISNSYIIMTIMEWLAINGYLAGNDTSDLFISIGWTSPERFDIYPTAAARGSDTSYWQTIGPWIFEKDFDTSGHYPIDSKFKDHLEFYYLHLKNEQTDYYQWVLEIVKMQNLLKNLGIKFLMHQAIYNNDHYKTGIDKVYDLTNMFHGAALLWESVEKATFLRKEHDNMSLYSYLKDEVNTLNHGRGDHPSKQGHEMIANLLHTYIVENHLC
mgnify:FL=1